MPTGILFLCYQIRNQLQASFMAIKSRFRKGTIFTLIIVHQGYLTGKSVHKTRSIPPYNFHRGYLALFGSLALTTYAAHQCTAHTSSWFPISRNLQCHLAFDAEYKAKMDSDIENITSICEAERQFIKIILNYSSLLFN